MTIDDKVIGKIEKNAFYSKVKILSHRNKRKKSDLEIMGRIKNITKDEIHHVQLLAKFYDKTGDYIDRAYDDVFNLGPDEAYKFNIKGSDANKIVNYKLRVSAVH